MRVKRGVISYSPQSLCVCVCRHYYGSWSSQIEIKHTHTLSRPIFKHAQHTHAALTLPLGDTPNARALPQTLALRAGRSRRLPKSKLPTTHNHHHHHHHHHHPFLFQLLLKVFIVALVIFKWLNPGAAEDGAEGVLVVRRHLPAAEPTPRLPLGDT